MIKTLYRKHKKGFRHFFRFQAVSAVSFLVDFGVLTFLNRVLGLPLVACNIVSYTCGVICSFLLNRYWTFGIKLKFFSVHFLKFLFVNLTSLGINTLAVYVFGGLYLLPNFVSKLLATPFSFTINFAGNKLLVFSANRLTGKANQ